MRPRIRARRSVVVAATCAVAVAAMSGCNQNVGNRATSGIDEPFNVAGLAVSDGPSGPREGVPDAQRPVVNAAGNEADIIAINAIADIERFWAQEYPKVFGDEFVPVSSYVSWDSAAAGGEVCGFPTEGFGNAMYCDQGNLIAWDRGGFVPYLIQTFTPMGAVFVLAHEYGHAAQFRALAVNESTPTIVSEQQADCFGGAFMRYVAEGGSEHFALDVGEGLNSVLESTLSLRDPDTGVTLAGEHGPAFERVSAFQIGFTDGAGACAKIDKFEIDTRRGDLPQLFTGPDDTGELEVTRESIDATTDSLRAYFDLADPPLVEYSGTDETCPDRRGRAPVSYCPATNTIGIDLDALVQRSTSNKSGETRPDSPEGDFNAYALLASRYALAAQHSLGKALTGPETALRSACLTGAWTTALANGEAGRDVALSRGDLDEAVSGLLADGLVASDVDDRTVPGGFSRVDALRTGVIDGQDGCDVRYH